MSQTVNHSHNGSIDFTPHPPLAGTRKQMMAAEIDPLCVGPMPAELFLSTFFPETPENNTLPAFSKTAFANFTKAKLEKHWYEPFVTLVAQLGIMPGMVLADSSRHADWNADQKIKPDISAYFEQPTPEPSSPDFRYRQKDEASGKLNPLQWLAMILFIEMKATDGDDPFDDVKTHRFLKDGDPQYAIYRGQLAQYATQLFRHQHRRSVYNILLCEKHFRLMRWDRAGVIVSERIPFTTDCTILVKFLYRVAKATPEGYGMDPTVCFANAHETLEAKRLLGPDWTPKYPRPVIKFKVLVDEYRDLEAPAASSASAPPIPDPPSHPFNSSPQLSDQLSEPPVPSAAPPVRTEPAYREFLAWGAACEPNSPTGRSTRAYAVVEVRDGQVLPTLGFLKDTWRPAEMGTEAKTLRILENKGVQNVPRLDCGGDVLGCPTTVTQTFSKTKQFEWAQGKLSAKARFHKRIQHRFVEKFIGKPLSSFKNSTHLLQIARDILIAVQGAWQAGWLHRDISAGNIMIDANGHGVLNDWDLAIDIFTFVRLSWRTGTWQFIAANILMNPSKQHELQDDLESVLHTIMYTGLRYLPHTKKGATADLLTALYDETYVKNVSSQAPAPVRSKGSVKGSVKSEPKKVSGLVLGGRNKESNFKTREYIPVGFSWDDDMPFTTWVITSMSYAQQWIEWVQAAETQARAQARSQANEKADLPDAHRALGVVIDQAVNNKPSRKTLAILRRPNIPNDMPFKDVQVFILLTDLMLDEAPPTTVHEPLDNCSGSFAAPAATSSDVSAGITVYSGMSVKRDNESMTDPESSGSKRIRSGTGTGNPSSNSLHGIDEGDETQD